MSKLKLSGGSSSENSVAFFSKDVGKGIEAIRLEDGTITTRKPRSKMKFGMLRRWIFLLALFREFSFLLGLPKWFYHVPTIILVILFICGIVEMMENHEMRMYHGAEHKVANCYAKRNMEFNPENIKRCSRINRNCGSNLLGTIVTFQLASSICMIGFNIHIPEIITAILPLYVYNIFPFNVLGLLTQLLTTATPQNQHIQVAVYALNALVKSKQEISK